jgi:hypothetical protein
MVVSYLGAIKVILPGMNPLKSAKPMCQAILGHLPEDKEIVAYRLKLAPFNFYTGLHKIGELKEEEDLMQALIPHRLDSFIGGKQFYHFTKKTLIPANIQVVEKSKIGHRTFILLEKKA